MLTNLWLLGLFFLANILIALAFLSYSWIYLDAFLSQKASKDAFRSLGGILMASYFILNVLNYHSIFGDITLIMLVLFNAGLFTIFYGNLMEPVPGLPDDGENKHRFKPINYFVIITFLSIGAGLAFLNTIPEFSKIAILLNFGLFGLILIYILLLRRSFLEPARTTVQDGSDLNILENNFKRQRNLSLIVTIIPFFTAPLLAILITFQNFKKIIEGLSKEFKFLGYFWIAFTGFSILQLLSFLGTYYFVFLNSLTTQYSILWIIEQVVLVVSAILMFRWISFFISFRVNARLFLFIWQILIFLTVVLASAYSIMLINSSEKQVNELLTKNANLIQYNLDQIKLNNLDVLNLLGKNNKLTAAIKNNDSSVIQDEVGNFISSNSFLDKVQVINTDSSLIFDSESPTDEGISQSDNLIITDTIYNRASQSGFVVDLNSTQGVELNYQFTYPVLESDGKLDGIITSIKRLDNNYLDQLKKESDQELIIYANKQKVASTILDTDNANRLENLPLVIDSQISSQDNISFYKGRILTTPYYLAIVSIKTTTNGDLANIVIGTKQSVLIEITENSLYQIFLLSLAIIILATIPSYFLSKNLRKDISA